MTDNSVTTAAVTAAALSAADSNRKNRSRRLISARAAFAFHSFLGLKMSFVLMLILVSGTLCVFNDEIDWLIYPQMRAEAAPSVIGPAIAESASVDEILASAQAARPDLTVRFVELASRDHWRAAKLTARDAQDTVHHIWIDPHSGDYQGTTPRLTPGNFLYRLHFTLFLPFGRHVVNLFGPIILFSLISGLLTYKKFWRGFFVRPRTGNRRQFLGDMHRLTAVWSLWFLVLLSSTGVWWFYNETVAELSPAPLFYSNEGPQEPVVDLGLLGAPQTVIQTMPEQVSLDGLVEKAELAIPQLQVRNIRIPQRADQPVKIMGSRGETLIHENANSVFFDPYSGDILAVNSSADWSGAQRVNRAMVPLHYGSWARGGFADIAVKTLWFIFGAGVSFLAISGFLIFARRTRKQAGKLSQSVRRGTSKAAMGRFRFAVWAILVLSAIGAIGSVITELGLLRSGDDSAKQEAQFFDPKPISQADTQSRLMVGIDQ